MTEAQLTANRENAQHSTGPRTQEGRKRSSLNAFRHGLTGQIVIHTPEDEQAFKKHCDGIREALASVGALEIYLAQAIAENRWRRRGSQSVSFEGAAIRALRQVVLLDERVRNTALYLVRISEEVANLRDRIGRLEGTLAGDWASAARDRGGPDHAIKRCENADGT